MLAMTTLNIIYTYIMVYISVQCHLEMTLLPTVLELCNSLTPTSPLPHIMDICSRLHCVPPKFIRWRPNPQHLRKWLYLEMVPLTRWLSSKEAIGWTLIQTGVLTGVRTHREASQVLVRRVMTMQEHSRREPRHLQAKERGVKQMLPLYASKESKPADTLIWTLNLH